MSPRRYIEAELYFSEYFVFVFTNFSLTATPRRSLQACAGEGAVGLGGKVFCTFIEREVGGNNAMG